MNLLRLPAEIIAEIFEYLDDRDVFSARESNPILDKASFSHFGKRFFRKKGFMITSPSLYALDEIARHDQLAKHVQHVWFNPDCYTFVRPECAPDDEDEDLDEVDDLITPLEKKPEVLAPINAVLSKQYDAYTDCMRDHRELMYTSKLQDLLALAFERLPNLRTVGMRRSEDYSPYGWSILRDEIGEDPRVLGPIPSTPSFALSGPTQLFRAIIGALARTRTQLERLYTDAIEIDNIRTEHLAQAELDAACSSILYLELNAVKGWLSIKPTLEAKDYSTLPDPADYAAGLIRLLAATPNLKELGLQIFPDRKQSHLLAPSARDPESWRRSYPYLCMHHLATTVHLPNLTRLKLEKFTTTSPTLQNFLTPCAASLSSLKIRDIRLLPASPTEDQPRPWQSFFTFLGQSSPNLDYVLFYHLMHARGGVTFAEENQPGAAQTQWPPDSEQLLIDHVPASHGGQAVFANYTHITLEAQGREAVRAKLEEVCERHWYQKPLFSYAMDEQLWHTDTSDEEW